MKILVAITGASGLQYGVRLAEVLKKQKHDVCIVASDAAKAVAEYERVKLPKADYGEDDFQCPYVSGSNPPDAMVVAPCSLKTLGQIANGIASNVITRSAEVTLKERKKLILLVRETPLSLIAIENMRRVALAGGVVMPACPGFYHKPKKIGDVIDFVVARVLDHLGIRQDLMKRWKS
ncbi:UbiX family flavin prenyltransferase [Candidatus Micrarchaeota archaeon]|nr:UbiX family flavin prenyltransferase [Candidatus Micrarchaeota archaeon]